MKLGLLFCAMFTAKASKKGCNRLIVLNIFGFNNILFGNEHTLVSIYTISCETGSDSKRKAYIKAISCIDIFKNIESLKHV